MREYRQEQYISNDLVVLLLASLVYFWLKRYVHISLHHIFIVLLLVLVLALIGYLVVRLPKHLDIKNWHTMSGLKFEDQAALWLKMDGFNKVIKTEYYDMGVDLIAHKDGVRYAVQVKRYTNPVGVAAVRAVVSGMVMYGCTQCMVMTNSTFTTGAQRLAMANNCRLIDGGQLASAIKKP